MRVYISGPITGVPIEKARLAFKNAAAAMAMRGYEPVNPCDLPTPAGCPCPDTSGTGGSGTGHTWSCYMRKDIAALATCDAILMLPGWQGSHGARREFDIANTLGLDVMFTLDAAWKQIDHPAAQVVEDILAELAKAMAKFPDQHLPNGTGGGEWAVMRDRRREVVDHKLSNGTATWMDVVLEESYEAFAETDPVPLRAELVQVAAMAIRWIQDIDRRPTGEPVEASDG